MEASEVSELDKAKARALAEWWGFKLQGGTGGIEQFETAGYFKEGGESALRGSFGGFMVDMIMKDQPKPTPEQVEAFVASLAERIQGEMIANRRGWVSVMTDYGPCRSLAESLTVAGLDKHGDLRLPWKTHTSLDEDQVRVACGYAAPSDRIWETKRLAIQERALVLLSDWLNLKRSPSGADVFGFAGAPWKSEKKEGFVEDPDAAAAWWMDDHFARRVVYDYFNDAPFTPFGDFEELVTDLVKRAIAAAPSELGIKPGAKKGLLEIVRIAVTRWDANNKPVPVRVGHDENYRGEYVTVRGGSAEENFEMKDVLKLWAAA